MGGGGWGGEMKFTIYEKLFFSIEVLFFAGNSFKKVILFLEVQKFLEPDVSYRY
jgi:hypothetical protein